jgi:hypothetical protein
MKRIALVLAAAAALAVPAAQANAAKAPPKGPTMAQFNALKKTVAKLQKDLTEARNIGIAGLQYDVCLTAVTADAFQGTWQALDTQLQALSRPVVFGPQTPINDLNVCQQALQIPRAHNLPPTIAQFSAMTALFGPYRWTAVNLLLAK